MKIELIRGGHSVGEANLHLVLTPAYRRMVFDDETVRVRKDERLCNKCDGIRQ